MKFLFLLTSIGFFLWIVRHIAFWVSLWQVKEYRFDRLFAHLKETYQGKRLIFSGLNIGKWVLIIFFIGNITNREYLIPLHFIIAWIYLIEVYLLLRDIWMHRLKRPVPTAKAVFICVVTIVLIGYLYTIPLVDQYLWFLLLDKLVVFIIFLLVIITGLPSELHQDYKVEKAIRKINLYKKTTLPTTGRKFSGRDGLLVIGITGSYGKSSTKEYVSQILQRKFKVIKTPGTNNTPIGVANTVLQKLNQEVEIFVVEMGAYKIGEISLLCRIVNPSVGILTAIADQHLSLFGSQEKLMRAKYELIDSLPKDGLALFNADSENALALAKITHKPKILYAVEEKKSEKDKKVDIIAKNVVMDKTSLSFDAILQKKTYRLKAPLLGIHNVSNILPGVYLAHRLGMTDAEIKQAVSLLRPVAKTMVRHSLANGVTVIDDTFNASPDSVRAAIAYMKVYKGKKAFVLEPMIELGKHAKSVHWQLGKETGNTCDFLFLTNNNFLKEIKKGLKESNGKCQVFVKSASEIAEFINIQLETGDVVVFEGKTAGIAFAKLL